MKKITALLLSVIFLLCACSSNVENVSSPPSLGANDSEIVGKWIDVQTEQIIEYTKDGFYYEYINESFTADKTRYLTESGNIYYYLDGEEPDMSFGIDYEIKNGHLFIAGVIEYKPMNLKTSIEEME